MYSQSNLDLSAPGRNVEPICPTDEAGPQSLEVGQLLALAAHELRNPLLPMRLRIQLARVGRASDVELGECLDAIDRQVDYMQRLVDDILEWARPTGFSRLLVRKPTDLSTIVKAAAESMMPLADAKQVAFAVAVDHRPHVVIGHTDRLQQMCINLIANALKFTGSGGSVTVELWRDAAGEMLRIIDSGIGIPPDHLETIFEPFVTGLGTHGLGLGLSIVRQVAQTHGGWVKAESAGPGQGATFTVCLPAAG